MTKKVERTFGCKPVLLAGILGIASLGQTAKAVTFTFQENDSPANTSTTLGNSSTFIEGAYSIVAKGYTVAGAVSALYAKYSGPGDETGLGMVTDAFSDHEIDPRHFIQLNLSSLKSLGSIEVWLGSVQAGESGTIYATTTAGVLPSTPVGTLTKDGFFDVTSYVLAGDYIDISAGSQNVLITSVTAGKVPDGGTTFTLLAAVLPVLGLLRKKLAA